MTAIAGQKMYRVSTNPKLFVRYKALALSISEHLSWIVQNDMELKRSDIVLWMETGTKTLEKLNALLRETLEYIKKPEKEQLQDSRGGVDEELMLGIRNSTDVWLEENNIEPKTNDDETESVF